MSGPSEVAATPRVLQQAGRRPSGREPGSARDLLSGSWLRKDAMTQKRQGCSRDGLFAAERPAMRPLRGGVHRSISQTRSSSFQRPHHGPTTERDCRQPSDELPLPGVGDRARRSSSAHKCAPSRSGVVDLVSLLSAAPDCFLKLHEGGTCSGGRLFGTALMLLRKAQLFSLRIWRSSFCPLRSVWMPGMAGLDSHASCVGAAVILSPLTGARESVGGAFLER